MKRLLFGVYQAMILLLLPPLSLYLLRRLVGRPAYRDGVMQRLGLYPRDFFKAIEGRQVIWVHAVSVGEVISSELFIQSLRRRYPKAGIIFSTTTPTGQAAARQRLKGVDQFIYFPFDLPWVTRSVVERISPALFIFLETELWPNFLRTLSKKGIPSILINGRISERGFRRYRRVRFFLSAVLEEVSLFLMQTEQDAEKIRTLGAPSDRVIRTGNMKYDQAASRGVPKEAETLRTEIGLAPGERLMIAGSTHEGEEESVLDAYRIIADAIGPMKLLIAPRHLDRLGRVEELLTQRGMACVRKTALNRMRNEELGMRNERVILLDTLGELDQYYALADLVFVGGSLVPIGGHNVLEVAAHRRPVFFGPYMSNFKEIADQLKGSGGGMEISGGKEMGLQMVWLMQHSDEMKKRGESAYQVVLANRGAVMRNLEQVARWLEN